MAPNLANPRKIKGTSGLLHPPRHIRAASAKCKRGFCILGGHLPGANRAIIASAASMMLGQYALYEIWTFLYDNCTEFAEKPLFLDWHLGERYLFHCNFENVDKARFPSMREDLGYSSGPLGARKGSSTSS